LAPRRTFKRRSSVRLRADRPSPPIRRLVVSSPSPRPKGFYCPFSGGAEKAGRGGFPFCSSLSGIRAMAGGSGWICSGIGAATRLGVFRRGKLPNRKKKKGASGGRWFALLRKARSRHVKDGKGLRPPYLFLVRRGERPPDGFFFFFFFFLFFFFTRNSRGQGIFDI